MRHGDRFLTVDGVFQQLDVDEDNSVQARDIFRALKRLGLTADVAEVWRWLQAVDGDEMELDSTRFSRFMELGDAAQDVEHTSVWMEPTPGDINRLQKPAAGESEWDDNMDQALWETREKQLRNVMLRRSRLEHEHSELTQRYRRQEEDERGPNPRFEEDGTVVCWVVNHRTANKTKSSCLYISF